MRLIDQGGVRLNGQTVEDKGLRIEPGVKCMLQVGRRRFARVTLVSDA